MIFLRTLALFAGLAWAASGAAQSTDGESHVWVAYADQPAEPQDDPSYAVYRKGYGLVMEEQWAEAMKRFEDLQSRYPASQYVDDAAYWSAFALKQTDGKKALAAYATFLQRFPRSRYFGDAAADYAYLRMREAPSGREDSTAARWHILVPPQPLNDVDLHPGSVLSMTVRRLNRSLSGRVAITIEQYDSRIRPNETLSRDLRLKLETLAALGEIRDDEQAFRTLRDAARDPLQPPLFRTVALRSLSQFSRFDPLPVLTDAARNDTSIQVRRTAIVCIGNVQRDKPRAVETLAGIYEQTPENEIQQRGIILGAVANVGNEQALTFLTRVARSSANDELQLTAIDHMSVTGKDKHRSVEALIGLFRSLPADRRQAMQAALYGVAEVGTDRAVEFLAGVASSHEDYDLRREAVYYLGNIGGEKARHALFEILKSP
jgi:hypothetical protein